MKQKKLTQLERIKVLETTLTKLYMAMVDLNMRITALDGGNKDKED